MNRDSAALDWPTFDAVPLREIAAAIQRRRKALAYHRGLTCGREFSESAAGAVERLNLEVGHLRLCIWADGVMWLAVCIRGFGPGSGWVFKETFHGDTYDVSGEALVGMIEATLALPFGSDLDRERQALWAVWVRVHPYKG